MMESSSVPLRVVDEATYHDQSYGPVTTFPMTEEEFKSDPRVSFARLSGKWTLEMDDGSEFEYDEALRRWIPVLDEALLENQQAVYAVPGVDESEPIQPRNKKKRKVNSDGEGQNGQHKRAKQPGKSGEGEHKEKKNTAVYITNLPLDVTVQEINSLFSKCGVISEELDRGKPRIKIYTDENGKPKGDALVVYFRPESVDLAIQMLDDTDFRLGDSNPSGTMRVQAANFSHKEKQGVQQQPLQDKKNNPKEKRKVIAKTQKLNSKLADWDDDDLSTIPQKNTKFEKTVILKHMFTLKELEEDPTAILDLKEDIREECEKLGDVSNVVLYDQEEDGVVSVRFANAESARACMRVMNGRFFAGQKVEAYIFDGMEKFKKTRTKQNADDAEESERLEKFGDWLEQDENQ